MWVCISFTHIISFTLCEFKIAMENHRLFCWFTELEDGDVPLIGNLTSETSFLVPYVGSISFDFSQSFDHCLSLPSGKLTYITMENHHF